MTLPEFIMSFGSVSAASRELKICRASLIQWKNFRNLPRDEQKYFLVQVSGGELTYTDIIEPFFNKALRGYNVKSIKRVSR